MLPDLGHYMYNKFKNNEKKFHFMNFNLLNIQKDLEINTMFTFTITLDNNIKYMGSIVSRKHSFNWYMRKINKGEFPVLFIGVLRPEEKYISSSTGESIIPFYGDIEYTYDKIINENENKDYNENYELTQKAKDTLYSMKEYIKLLLINKFKTKKTTLNISVYIDEDIKLDINGVILNMLNDELKVSLPSYYQYLYDEENNLKLLTSSNNILVSIISSLHKKQINNEVNVNWFEIEKDVFLVGGISRHGRCTSIICVVDKLEETKQIVYDYK